MATTSSGEHCDNVLGESPQLLALRHVPVTRDPMSFDEHQAVLAAEIDRRTSNALRHKQRDWQYTVQHMRSGFLRLLPADVANRKSVSPATDVVQVHKVRTQYSDFSDDESDVDLDDDPDTRDSATRLKKRHVTASGEDEAVGKCRGRYQLRFNLFDMVPSSVSVAVEDEVIVVRALRSVPASTVESPQHQPANQKYQRRVAKPDMIDKARLKAVLSADGILTIEAPVLTSNIDTSTTVAATAETNGEDSSLTRNEEAASGCTKMTNGENETKPMKDSLIEVKTPNARPKSPRGSAGGGSSEGGGTGDGSTPAKEKIGVPIFRDENGTRRMHLAVDLGPVYRPRDVIVQVVKENRIQIRAKHRERSGERQSKSKFIKEYELGEKIEPYSLQGGLTASGKLIVCAYAKNHGPVAPE